MIGALYIGLSGMTAYSTGLREVSNNITNLNSDGYKATSVGFNDLFGSSSGGVSYTDSITGNGAGVELSSSQLDLSQGDIRQTSNDLDLAVEGNGFLVLEKGGEYFYTRTGSFEVSENGNIMLSGTDYNLMVLNSSGELENVSLNGYRNAAPEATTVIEFSGTLSTIISGDSVIDDSEHTISGVEVFDVNGNSTLWSFTFTPRPGADGNQWTVIAKNQDGDELDRGVIAFIDNQIDPQKSQLKFSDATTSQSLTLDFSENVEGFTLSTGSDLAANPNGFIAGTLISITVDENGILQNQYSNEQFEDLGAIALADFQQSKHLEQQGAGIFSYGSSTGIELLTSESERVGLVSSNRIEASNVDLSQQFGDLILVQRGYQASSQVVSVSNDMIQQLFGLRGQG